MKGKKKVKHTKVFFSVKARKFPSCASVGCGDVIRSFQLPGGALSGPGRSPSLIVLLPSTEWE